MQPEDLLRDLPGYPYTAWLLVVLLGLGYLAKTVRDRPQKQARTNANLGSRLQRVETAQELERVRRLQVEHELTRLGVPLSWWPPDPDAPRPPAPRPPARVDQLDVDEDQADDDPPTRHVPVPPIPHYPQHRRTTP
jgi:hypothetical protein